MKSQRDGHCVFESTRATLSHCHPYPIILSLPFDKLRMIGNSNLRLCGHFDKLSANGVGWAAHG
jgi:hypothetical protein